MAELEPQSQPAGLLRRLGALLYDTLSIIAFEMLATAVVLPLSQTDSISVGNNLFRVYLLAVAFLFFGWFWTHGGQTLGMRAWRIRLVDWNGDTVSWQQCALRFLGALVSALPIGLGYLWILFDNEKASWHDRFSKTRVIYTPRRR